MRNPLRRFLNNQKGQALPMVLCVLAIGSLTIAGSLNYSTTALKGSRIIRQGLDGIYAAGAGIEHTLWSLKKGVTPLTQLPEQINRMTIDITTVNSGNYTLYLGEMVGFSSKPGVIIISGNLIEAGEDRYLYTITVARSYEQGAQTIHLQEVGARLPVGYTYNNSANRSDGESLGSGNPVQIQDSAGAWMIRWLWPGGNERPVLRNQEGGDSFVLTFYITGTGNLEGEYAWTVADATGYGLYGELTGAWYHITATARRPSDNRTAARIIADSIIQNNGIVYVVSWKISN